MREENKIRDIREAIKKDVDSWSEENLLAAVKALYGTRLILSSFADLLNATRIPGQVPDDVEVILRDELKDVLINRKFSDAKDIDQNKKTLFENGIIPIGSDFFKILN